MLELGSSALGITLVILGLVFLVFTPILLRAVPRLRPAMPKTSQEPRHPFDQERHLAGWLSRRGQGSLGRSQAFCRVFRGTGEDAPGGLNGARILPTSVGRAFGLPGRFLLRRLLVSKALSINEEAKYSKKNLGPLV